MTFETVCIHATESETLLCSTATHSSDDGHHRRRHCRPVYRGSNVIVRVLDPEVMKIKVENGACSHVDGRYLSRADARSHRDRMRNSFLGREVSRPYLRTVYDVQFGL